MRTFGNREDTINGKGRQQIHRPEENRCETQWEQTRNNKAKEVKLNIRCTRQDTTKIKQEITQRRLERLTHEN